MITLEGVSKTYGTGEGRVEALKEINLTLGDGCFTAVVGKSGSGKSTLMNMIGALDKPTAGKVYYGETELTALDEKALAGYRNKNIGYVFQSFYLEPSFSVLENVCMPLTIAGEDRKTREEKARKLLERLGIDDKADKKAAELSGGQKQRVSIARALVNDPDVLLADEPTGNLDSENGEEVLKILRAVADGKKSVILVTHNIEDAKRYVNEIVTLSDGKILSRENNKRGNGDEISG